MGRRLWKVRLPGGDRGSDGLRIAAFSLLYFIAHQISFLFPASGKVMMYLWPASGIGLAGLLLSPRRTWAAMLGGFYLAGIAADVWIAHRPFWASVGYMTANIIESFLCAFLILRSSREHPTFSTMKEVFALFLGAVVINAGTAALGAATSVLFQKADFFTSWVGWYIPDGLGILILVPFFVTLAPSRIPWRWVPSWKALELLAFLLIWSLAAWFSLGPADPGAGFSLRLYPYMLIALLAWPAMRFGRRTVATTLVILAALAIAELLLHEGITSLGGKSAQGRLTEVQIFIAFAAFTGYTLSALHAESRRAEQEARTDQERLRLATQAARLGVWDWDISNNRLSWDDQNHEIFGVPKTAPPEAMESWLQKIHPEDAPRCQEELARALRGESGYDTEFRIVLDDGEIKHIKTYGKVTRNAEGQPIRLTGINYDISTQRKAEAEKRDLEKQLLQAQRLEAIGTLSSGIAHDFNNILGIILVNTSTLALKVKDLGDLGKQVEMIRQATDRGAALVRQLLTFARKSIIQKEPTSINALILETVKFLGETIPKTIALRTDLEDALPSVHADPNQIHQVLFNLGLNAKDAMPAGGTLAFATSVVSGNTLKPRFPEARSWPYICIRIDDTGHGMDAETLRQIFDPFFSTKAIGKGTGLGVSVAQGIVRNHDGFIEVQSEPGQGTHFWIYLPVTGTAELPAAPPPVSEEEAPGGSETILLIEDEPVIQDILAELLTGKGYTVILADAGDSGIETFLRHQGDIRLVVSDFGLPTFGGDEVYARLRQVDARTPFLLMTGYIEPADHRELLDRGIFDILTKPFHPSSLLVAVRKAIDAAPTGPAGS